MTPFLRPLLVNGLHLLANAAAIKGKLWLKEQTGVDLDQPALSEADLVKLKQFEATHEDELLKIRLDQDRLNLGELSLSLADAANARQRELDLVKAGAAGIATKTPTILALVTAVFVLGALTTFVFSAKPGGVDKDVLLYVSGVFSAILAQIYSYYFGSSSGSRDKSQTLDHLLRSMGGPK